MWVVARRSGEARKVLRELDAQLADNAARSGMKLSSTPAEQAVLTLIADQIDRKVELFGEYQVAVDAKSRTRLSAEVRLREGSIARLLKQVQIDARTDPRYESQVTRRARYGRCGDGTRMPLAEHDHTQVVGLRKRLAAKCRAVIDRLEHSTSCDLYDFSVELEWRRDRLIDIQTGRDVTPVYRHELGPFAPPRDCTMVYTLRGDQLVPAEHERVVLPG